MTVRPFLEGRILGLNWVIEPNRLGREGPLKKMDKISREYKVPLPDERILFGQVALDLVAKHGNHHFLEEEQKQVLGRKDKCGGMSSM